MREVSPQVFVLAETKLNQYGVGDFLRAIGAPDDWRFETDAKGWHPRTDADMLVELAGRACYKSFGTELNDNITRVRQEPSEYLDNILESRHGSTLEHASVTFGIHDVSRVFTHELITHRVGTAKSQESLRFVRSSELGFWIPPELEPVREQVVSIVETLEQMSVQMARELGIDNMSFSDKKKVTSALRRLLPDGMATTIVWTSNLRTLRHCIQVRTHRSAEREIRLVFGEIARVCIQRWPLLFDDFEALSEPDGIPEYTTPWPKV